VADLLTTGVHVEPQDDALTLWLMTPEAPEVPLKLEELLHRPEWQSHAACRGQGSDLWVADSPGAPYETHRVVCAGCPVREPCLSYALANKSLKGFWGGTTERERQKLRRASAEAPGPATQRCEPAPRP
jgi:WhiB family transcriptional regulator, redox-sensing transcriptional regulator